MGVFNLDCYLNFINNINEGLFVRPRTNQLLKSILFVKLVKQGILKSQVASKLNV